MANTKTLMEHKTNLEGYSLELMKLVNGLQGQTLVNGDIKAANGTMELSPCQIWQCIQRILVGSCNSSQGILNRLCEELKEILCNDRIKNCELKKQLVRALRLCECLANAIKNTMCNDNLGELVGKLFCLLVQIILLVVAIIAKIIILLIFCSGRCGNNIFANCDNGDVLSSFCECLICDLEKELDDIEKLIDKLNKLAIIFVTHGSKKCKCDKFDYDYGEGCNCFKHGNYLGYDDKQTGPAYDYKQKYTNTDDYQNYMNPYNYEDYDNFNNYDNRKKCNNDKFNDYDDRKKCNHDKYCDKCKCHKQNKCRRD